jgi:hypothetical protein
MPRRTDLRRDWLERANRPSPRAEGDREVRLRQSVPIGDAQTRGLWTVMDPVRLLMLGGIGCDLDLVDERFGWIERVRPLQSARVYRGPVGRRAEDGGLRDHLGDAKGPAVRPRAARGGQICAAPGGRGQRGETCQRRAQQRTAQRSRPPGVDRAAVHADGQGILGEGPGVDPGTAPVVQGNSRTSRGRVPSLSRPAMWDPSESNISNSE